MPQKNHNACPQCNKVGKIVDNATIKSLISVSLHRVKDIQHRFCATADCTVAYYAEDGSEIFNIQDLRERIYQKEPDAADVLVCYCFFHSLGDILKSETDDTSNPIVDDINQGIQQGQCACDWRNPQGTCCLGNVLKILKSK